MDLALSIEGERACFRRPEMRDDLVTYDVMTPLAAQQILVRLIDPWQWSVSLQAITVMRPFRMQWSGGGGRLGASKRINALIDVAYVVEVSVRPRAGATSAGDILVNQTRRGDLFLGIRECPISNVRMLAADEPRRSPLTGTRDLGWMIFDLAAARGSGPRFFRAELRDGRMAIPSAEEIDFAY